MHRVDELDSYWSETIEDMQTKLEEVRVMARDAVANKVKEITDKITE